MYAKEGPLRTAGGLIVVDATGENTGVEALMAYLSYCLLYRERNIQKGQRNCACSYPNACAQAGPRYFVLVSIFVFKRPGLS